MRFGLGAYYSGPHCGDTPEVFTGRKRKPSRIEYGENWYLVGSRAAAQRQVFGRHHA
ncbi:MAG: DUF5348 domain-containing protein [Oscillospiraceae bacterium]|nr:DUF5348 domain-containing protein [Oscillospiraceae bacterium]